MATVDYTSDEIVRRGEERYQRDLRHGVEGAHRGRLLVLDIVSGEHEIADDDLTATLRLLEREPGAITYAVRIGHPEVYQLGRVAPGQRP